MIENSALISMGLKPNESVAVRKAKMQIKDAADAMVATISVAAKNAKKKIADEAAANMKNIADEANAKTRNIADEANAKIADITKVDKDNWIVDKAGKQEAAKRARQEKEKLSREKPEGVAFNMGSVARTLFPIPF